MSESQLLVRRADEVPAETRRGGEIRTLPGPCSATSVTGLSTSTASRNVPARTVRVSPGSATSRASRSVAYSPPRRRQREALSCVTRTLSSPMAICHPRLRRLRRLRRDAARSAPP